MLFEIIFCYKPIFIVHEIIIIKLTTQPSKKHSVNEIPELSALVLVDVSGDVLVAVGSDEVGVADQPITPDALVAWAAFRVAPHGSGLFVTGAVCTQAGSLSTE